MKRGLNVESMLCVTLINTRNCIPADRVCSKFSNCVRICRKV